MEVNQNMDRREQEADSISQSLLELTNISIEKTQDQGEPSRVLY